MVEGKEIFKKKEGFITWIVWKSELGELVGLCGYISNILCFHIYLNCMYCPSDEEKIQYFVTMKKVFTGGGKSIGKKGRRGSYRLSIESLIFRNFVGGRIHNGGVTAYSVQKLKNRANKAVNEVYNSLKDKKVFIKMIKSSEECED